MHQDYDVAAIMGALYGDGIVGLSGAYDAMVVGPREVRPAEPRSHVVGLDLAPVHRPSPHPPIATSRGWRPIPGGRARGVRATRPP